jgi:hypothetical protein
MEPFVYVSPT